MYDPKSGGFQSRPDANTDTAKKNTINYIKTISGGGRTGSGSGGGSSSKDIEMKSPSQEIEQTQAPTPTTTASIKIDLPQQQAGSPSAFSLTTGTLSYMPNAVPQRRSAELQASTTQGGVITSNYKKPFVTPSNLNPVWRGTNIQDEFTPAGYKDTSKFTSAGEFRINEDLKLGISPEFVGMTAPSIVSGAREKAGREFQDKIDKGEIEYIEGGNKTSEDINKEFEIYYGSSRYSKDVEKLKLRTSSNQIARQYDRDTQVKELNKVGILGGTIVGTGLITAPSIVGVEGAILTRSVLSGAQVGFGGKEITRGLLQKDLNLKQRSSVLGLGALNVGLGLSTGSSAIGGTKNSLLSKSNIEDLNIGLDKTISSGTTKEFLRIGKTSLYEGGQTASFGSSATQTQTQILQSTSLNVKTISGQDKIINKIKVKGVNERNVYDFVSGETIKTIKPFDFKTFGVGQADGFKVVGRDKSISLSGGQTASGSGLLSTSEGLREVTYGGVSKKIAPNENIVIGGQATKLKLNIGKPEGTLRFSPSSSTRVETIPDISTTATGAFYQPTQFKIRQGKPFDFNIFKTPSTQNKPSINNIFKPSNSGASSITNTNNPTISQSIYYGKGQYELTNIGAVSSVLGNSFKQGGNKITSTFKIISPVREISISKQAVNQVNPFSINFKTNTKLKTNERQTPKTIVGGAEMFKPKELQTSRVTQIPIFNLKSQTQQKQDIKTFNIPKSFNARGFFDGGKPPIIFGALPKLSLDFGNTRVGKEKPTTRRYKYTPSFTAIVKGIRGKETKAVTGIGFRPIPKGFDFAFKRGKKGVFRNS